MNKIKPSILLIGIAIGIFSCHKDSTSSTPTHPALDTVYLRKSQMFYSYDASGNKSADSGVWKWVYDDKRRQTMFVSNLGNGESVDSTVTSYSGNQAVTDYWVYGSGVLYSKGHQVFFYDANGNLDSARETGTSIIINNGHPTLHILMA
jgi:hypothetical protein